MTTDEAIAAIPTGWRIYKVDMSIFGRAAVILRQTDHIGFVSAQALTLADAIVSASAKAKWHYRGWTIEPSYVGYEATHPDYDYCYESGGNGLHVHGMAIENVKAQIDDKEDDR